MKKLVLLAIVSGSLIGHATWAASLRPSVAWINGAGSWQNLKPNDEGPGGSGGGTGGGTGGGPLALVDAERDQITSAQLDRDGNDGGDSPGGDGGGRGGGGG